MAKVIIIAGGYSTGKSRSLKNLDPEKTLMINYLGSKDLPFKGSRKMYNKSPKEGGNYIESPDASIIPTLLTTIPELSRFDVGVVDDLSYVQSQAYLKKARLQGFGKFVDIGLLYSDIINAALTSPLKYVILVIHTEPIFDGNVIVGHQFTSIGKMVSQYVKNEGLVTILVHTDVTTDENGVAKYEFVTNRQDTILAKSPEGMLPIRVENDVAQIIELAERYYNED